MYTFDTQLRQGAQGEHRLDAFFAHDWHITPATAIEQHQGIDRHFVHRASGEALTVEYKTDYTAARTHNAFLETVSADTPPEKLGWVYTCQADYLLYYVPGEGLIYVLRPERVRHFVGHWSHWGRPAVGIPNSGYRTWGFVVPLRVLERLAVAVLSC